MSNRLSKTRALVLQRITALLAQPDGWGPALCVELQLLTLLEVLHTLDGASDERIYSVQRRFSKFISEQAPGPPLPLAVRLGLKGTATDEFVTLLARFVQAEQMLDAELVVIPVLVQRALEDSPTHGEA